ncbi:4-alpha-glucanotransferase [Pollutimonas sp. M17]|uniref:4-alpha-glucanotransferase n=1 Tax=Pollutimonas sp. M17 TaxID=2962065 RepID=UPI0021F3CB2B|nr:4-alpha-glucanotransferase [Pollutimonas sp. M17]UYO93482.1 4-alpha-glucanotransferase [Pollutimonas sp. M17]
MNAHAGADAALLALAREAGLEAGWTDAFGNRRQVRDEILRRLLDALELPCASPSQIAESRLRLEREARPGGAGMVIVQADEAPVFAHAGPLAYSLELEGGGQRSGMAAQAGNGMVRIDPVSRPGYHNLSIGNSQRTLAVSPRRCPSVQELAGHRPGRPWGMAAQVYSLRGRHAGQYSLLAQLAGQAGKRGAAALAISPVHAMFSAAPQRFSPYSPSSRLFLNAAYIDPEHVLGKDAFLAALDPDEPQDGHGMATDTLHIDWAQMLPRRLRLFRRMHDAFRRCGGKALHEDLDAFSREGGEALASHARFEALHGSHVPELGPESGWQDWPDALHDPSGPGLRAYAASQEKEIHFHVFLQWLAHRGMLDAQRSALDAGMPLGLITDLAIGTDARGSHAWSRQKEILAGVSVGAPPDLYQSLGQDWGLTAMSPRALRDTGYAAFIEILRAAFRYAGGVRVDHILGLARMWLVAQGESPADGAYLRYPTEDMLRLLVLEAWRHQAIVVGENLGTVPEGFNEQLQEKNVMGMSVLWFQRDGQAGEDEGPPPFTAPRQWPAWTMATPTTHDLPTIAGWWQGRDLYWRERLGETPGHGAWLAAAQWREGEKKALCNAMRAAGSLPEGAPDPQADAPRDAILGFVAATPSPLVIIAMEDLLGMEDQPNLPGHGETGANAHPNWMQTLPMSVEQIFSDPGVASSLAGIARARGGA